MYRSSAPPKRSSTFRPPASRAVSSRVKVHTHMSLKDCSGTATYCRDGRIVNSTQVKSSELDVSRTSEAVQHKTLTVSRNVAVTRTAVRTRSNLSPQTCVCIEPNTAGWYGSSVSMINSGTKMHLVVSKKFTQYMIHGTRGLNKKKLDKVKDSKVE